MLSLAPAVVGIPGGIELVVIFFVMFFLFGVPVALALLLGYRYVKGQTEEDSQAQRIAELESELEELRAAVETDHSADASADTSTKPSTSTSTDASSNEPANSSSPTSSKESTDASADTSSNATETRGVRDVE